MMHDDALHDGIRKLLRTFGKGGQQVIEDAIQAGLVSGSLQPGQQLKATARLTLDGMDVVFEVDQMLTVEETNDANE